jgi:serpin B
MRGLARKTPGLLLGALLQAGCGLGSRSPTDSTPIHVHDAKAAAAACNLFGFDLYAKAKANDQNLVLSPLSAAAALAMAAAGARGETLAQMTRVLHVDGLADAHGAFGHLLVSLAGQGKEAEVGQDPAGGAGGSRRTQKPPEMAIANRIWGQKGFSYRADFLSLLQEQYSAPLGQLDFIRANEAASVEINAWVREQTRGRIPELLDKGTVDEFTAFA